MSWQVLAYIGPGAGFAFLGSFLAVVLSLLASFVSLCIWPFRMLWLALRRKGRFGKARAKKVIVLGLDGLEPKLTERWMAEGKLPHLRELAERGSYSRLRTTFPPLSPVAWSTFATGVNPGAHNIFDFLNRNLRTYAPELSSARVTESKKCGKLAIGRFHSRGRQSSCGAKANRFGRFWVTAGSPARFYAFRLLFPRYLLMASCYRRCPLPICAERKGVFPGSRAIPMSC